MSAPCGVRRHRQTCSECFIVGLVCFSYQDLFSSLTLSGHTVNIIVNQVIKSVIKFVG